MEVPSEFFASAKKREPSIDKSPPFSNLLRSLSASVAQLVEQLTLNFRTGFFSFSLLFAPVQNCYTSKRSHFSCSLAVARFRSKKCAGDTIRDTIGYLMPSAKRDKSPNGMETIFERDSTDGI
jgi:hypothetical protein